MKDAATYFFKVKIQMTRIALQDVNTSPYTSWRIVILGSLDSIGTIGDSSTVFSAPPAVAAVAAAIRQVSPRTMMAQRHAATPTASTRCPFHKQ